MLSRSEDGVQGIFPKEVGVGDVVIHCLPAFGRQRWQGDCNSSTSGLSHLYDTTCPGCRRCGTRGRSTTRTCLQTYDFIQAKVRSNEKPLATKFLRRNKLSGGSPDLTRSPDGPATTPRKGAIAKAFTIRAFCQNASTPRFRHTTNEEPKSQVGGWPNQNHMLRAKRRKENRPECSSSNQCSTPNGQRGRTRRALPRPSIRICVRHPK